MAGPQYSKKQTLSIKEFEAQIAALLGVTPRGHDRSFRHYTTPSGTFVTIPQFDDGVPMGYVVDIIEQLTRHESEKRRAQKKRPPKKADDTPELSVSSLIIPEAKTSQGVLIKSTSILWTKIAETLSEDWSVAFQIPPEKWEEIIAGAFSKAGFDEVTLTPRSGDFGRDVIAIRKGIGSIKIIGSVKAYKPGHLVKHDDVRALLGVMNGERDTSKGIITTTSDFAPRISTDPMIKPFMPTRLELVNGKMLHEWLKELAKKA
jgi:restriction system protein